MNKLLVDTNILIYAIDEESKYHIESYNLITTTNYDLFTTSKNISEFLTVITKYPQKCLTIRQALTIVEELKNFISIIYPSQYSFSIFIKLLEKYKPTGLKIHDFEIISIALDNNIKSIATINKKDFSGIKEIEIISF